MTNHTHILIFSIGPVQSFIAEARRTVDLYAGSQILIKLARAAATAVKNNNGTLIFPADLKADVPNKFVALVANPAKVAQQAQQTAEDHWRNFAKQALRKIGVKVDFTPEGEIVTDNPVLKDILKRQLKNHLEFYWVAAPYHGNYKHVYELADNAFGARKQLRNFHESTEDGFKDSLSGTRSALRTKKDDKDVLIYWEQIQKNRRRQLQRGELLDTLGTIKRFAFDIDFPSTSTVASASFARACAEKGLLTSFTETIEKFNRQVTQDGLDFPGIDRATLEKMRQQQDKGHFYSVGDFDRGFEYDGDLLYRETYTPQNLETRYNIPPELSETIKPITDALTHLYDNAKKTKLKPGRPSPYYTVLHMDGDSMGKHISKCNSLEKHQQLSQDLAAFTAQVEELVRKNGGYCIYAGGDDVLAFFPADKALTAANELAKVYRKQFDKPEWRQEDDGKPFPFTASIGLVYAHHLYPLDATLVAARQAEKRAKNKYGRNALSITVLRRSGETLEMGGKWDGELQANRPTPNTVDLVERLIKLLNEEYISSRFPYSVLKDAPVVTTLAGDGRMAILRQLLNRHRTQKLKDEVADDLLKEWLAWTEAYDKRVPLAAEKKCKQEDKEDKPLQNQGFYELARWFALAGWLAEGGSE